MTKATVSAEWQVLIPETFRDRLHLKPGTQLSVDVQGDSLILKPLSDTLPHWSTMLGMLRGADLLQDLAAEHAAEEKRDQARPQQSS